MANNVTDKTIKRNLENAREALIVAMLNSQKNDKSNKHMDRPKLKTAVEEIGRVLFEIDNPE